MRLFRRPGLAPSEGDAPPEQPPPVHELSLVIESDRGRAALFAQAERALPAGEVLVQARDLIGEHRSFTTLPLDPRATLVAKESPVVLRGGLTSIVRYYRVPADSMRAREEHYEDGRFSHAYEVTMRVVGRGRATPKPRALPA